MERHSRPITMSGGAWYERHFGDPDTTPPPLARFEEMAIAAVRDQLKIQVEPSRTHVTLQKNCIPQVSASDNNNRNIDNY